jgi:hypothetical protein
MTQTAAIQLQAIGTVPAVQLSEVQAGDTLVWNYGQTSEVVSLIKVTAKTYELTTRTADGNTWTQRKRGTTLVARAVVQTDGMLGFTR